MKPVDQTYSMMSREEIELNGVFCDRSELAVRDYGIRKRSDLPLHRLPMSVVRGGIFLHMGAVECRERVSV